MSDDFWDSWDAEQVAPTTEYKPIPAGTYEATIIEIDDAPNKAGTGRNLKIKFQIVDGEYKDRTVYSHLCIRHPNEEAQRIAAANLSAICRACGIMRPRSPDELRGATIAIKVALAKRKDTGEDSNEIKAYLPNEARKAATTQAATGATGRKNPFAK